MRLALSTLALLFLSGCCSLVWAAQDGFGPRFGNSAPYALQNDVNNALSDIQGIDQNDLNDRANPLGIIEPAAGDEESSKNQDFDENAEDDAYYGDAEIRVIPEDSLEE